MESKSAAATAHSRWGARNGAPVGLLHLTNAIAHGDVKTAIRLLGGLTTWAKARRIQVNDIDAILDDITAGRGKDAAARFWSAYDRAEAGAVPPEMGRPPTMEGGKRRNIYLDDATAEAAKALGGGNVSEGLRRAVEIALRSEK